MTTRICTECDQPVSGKATTCSPKCRARRSRRIAAERRDEQVLEQGEARALVDSLDEGARLQLVRDVFAQELAPHVKEVIDDDVLKGLEALAALTPALVESLVKDLGSNDAVARGRAQAIMAKYTFGALGGEKERQPGLNINLGSFPTPAGGDPGATVPPDLEPVIEATAQRVCPECQEPRDEDDFEPGAERCTVCQARLAAEIEGRFARPD